ncbi:MAG: hypothetical protein SOW32_06535 [Agathobacter sp.]|nr:hypothetical protein [Agathobacter sp.]
MDIVYKLWAFFGFLAFIQVCGISSRLRKTERSINSEPNTLRSSMKDDMRQILNPYIGKEIETIDFYEDEETDIFYDVKQNRFFLEDIDEKWALLKVITPKYEKQELIRISSIKGVTFVEENE